MSASSPSPQDPEPSIRLSWKKIWSSTAEGLVAHWFMVPIAVALIASVFGFVGCPRETEERGVDWPTAREEVASQSVQAIPPVDPAPVVGEFEGSLEGTSTHSLRIVFNSDGTLNAACHSNRREYSGYWFVDAEAISLAYRAIGKVKEIGAARGRVSDETQEITLEILGAAGGNAIRSGIYVFYRVR